MNAIEHLEENTWTKPSHYGGYSPDGDYLVYSQTRDSVAYERSNYQRILEDLTALAEKENGNERLNNSDEPCVWDWRAGHWAVGWVEYIMVAKDAPEAVKQAAGEIICALADYPIYDEMHASDLEWNEACEFWESLPVSMRVDYCREAGISIFAARRDEFPEDDTGALFERLRD